MKSPHYGVIYGLYHPLTRELRYVGQTTLTLNRRLSLHLTTANLSKRRHLTAWLQQLKQVGLVPKIETLAVARSRVELDQLEIQLIAEAHLRGDHLTNHTEGGRGMSGFTLSVETRAKMSASRKGHKVSESTRAKISSANKGLVRSDSLKAQWSVQHRTEQTTRLISEAQSESFSTTPRKVTPYKRKSMAGQQHHAYQKGVSTVLIIADLKAGLSRKQVAEKYAVTPRFICRRLVQAEREGLLVPKSNRGIPTGKILQKLGEGLTRAQVAEALGISVSLIVLRLRQIRTVNG
jgi:uncharacterized protein (DUF433 family)